MLQKGFADLIKGLEMGRLFWIFQTFGWAHLIMSIENFSLLWREIK